MQARVISVSQHLSFDDGGSYNFVVLELPNGVRVNAEVDQESLQRLTEAFVQSGGDVVEKVLANEEAATKEASVLTRKPLDPEYAHRQQMPLEEPVHRGFSPLELTEEGDVEFGGDLHVSQQNELAELERKFQNAASAIDRSVADSGELSSPALSAAVRRLSTPMSVDPLPKPNWAADHVPTRIAPVKIEADAKGNPIMKGAGLVDPSSLSGGAEGEDGDTGQI